MNWVQWQRGGLRERHESREDVQATETSEEDGKSWKFLKHIFAIIIRPIHVNTLSWAWKSGCSQHTICSRASFNTFSCWIFRTTQMTATSESFCSSRWMERSECCSAASSRLEFRCCCVFGLVLRRMHRNLSGGIRAKAPLKIIVLKFSWTNEFFTFSFSPTLSLAFHIYIPDGFGLLNTLSSERARCMHCDDDDVEVESSLVPRATSWGVLNWIFFSQCSLCNISFMAFHVVWSTRGWERNSAAEWKI